MAKDCLFCKILDGEISSRKIWEDDKHIAVLTPFPNTPGFTVLITKEHKDSYIFSLDDKTYEGIFKAAKEVARLLDAKLKCKRTGMIVEGMGINHAHVKLIPMHGIPDGEWQPVLSGKSEYSEVYSGYLSSHDGPLKNEEELEEVYRKIVEK